MNDHSLAVGHFLSHYKNSLSEDNNVYKVNQPISVGVHSRVVEI